MGDFDPITSNMDDERTTFGKRRRGQRCTCLWAVFATLLAIILFIALIAVAVNKSASVDCNLPVAASTVRWCTRSSSEQEKCLHMAAAFSSAGLEPNVTCVEKQSVEGCINALGSEVDAFTTDGGHIFSANQLVKPVMAENYGFGDATYWAVAVVKKSDKTTFLTKPGLTGKYSCHTGYQKSAGWNMPIGKLKELGIISGCGNSVISSVVNLFGKTCAPGGGGSLCSGCDGNCTRNCDGENYCSYTGAFRCLVEKGDIAFVKHTTVFTNTDGNNPEDWSKDLVSSKTKREGRNDNVTIRCKFSNVMAENDAKLMMGVCRPKDYELLCADGTRAPLAKYEICNLGKVPSHAVLVSVNAPESTAAKVKQLLLIGQLKFGTDSNSHFKLFKGSKKDLLFKSSTEILVPLHENCTSQRFLGKDYLNSMAQLNCRDVPPIPDGPHCLLPQYSNPIPSTLRWCVTSEEMEKCRNISKLAQDLGNAFYIVCVKANQEDECAKLVGQRDADLTNLDGGHIYSAGRDYNLIPFAAEHYGIDSNDKTASYYAVAVIKANDTSTRLTKEGLRGKKTCHTGYKKTAGWNVPIGYLAREKIIDSTPAHCDLALQVSNFFGGSCVPGVDKKELPKLCSICKWKNCSGSGEPYRSYTGALQCLKDGVGDVAFVNHLTVISPKEDQSQFKLLCKNGSTAAPSDYKQCNLEQVPSHALVTSPLLSKLFKERTWALLNQLQKAYNSTLFTSNGKSNQMFKDSTRCLWRIQDGCSWSDYLGQQYVETIQALECEPVAYPPTKPCKFIPTC